VSWEAKDLETALRAAPVELPDGRTLPVQSVTVERLIAASPVLLARWKLRKLEVSLHAEPDETVESLVARARIAAVADMERVKGSR
jgi:hypothetical protein